MNNNDIATEIRNNIAAIKSAAAGMNYPTWTPNEGQQARIAAFEAQLAELVG